MANMTNVADGMDGVVLTRNWGMVLFRGVLALIFGILTLTNPLLSLGTLMLFFGAFAIADGLFTIVAALANRRSEPHWGALLAGGVLSIILGILVFAYPGMTAIVLLYLIAAWAIIAGIAEIVSGIRLRKVITGEWALILAGVVSLLFGFFLLSRPGAGAVALALWIGLCAIAIGIVQIVLAFKLRSWTKHHQPAEAERPRRAA